MPRLPGAPVHRREFRGEERDPETTTKIDDSGLPGLFARKLPAFPAQSLQQQMLSLQSAIGGCYRRPSVLRQPSHDLDELSVLDLRQRCHEHHELAGVRALQAASSRGELTATVLHID